MVHSHVIYGNLSNSEEVHCKESELLRGKPLTYNPHCIHRMPVQGPWKVCIVSA